MGLVSSSLAPTFLVAMPQLLDPNFRRTVVLLVHHDEEGTFGIVLNRSTELTAPSLCATLDIAWHGTQAEPIGWGGPVQPQTGWVLFEDVMLFVSIRSSIRDMLDGALRRAQHRGKIIGILVEIHAGHKQREQRADRIHTAIQGLISFAPQVRPLVCRASVAVAAHQ